MVQSSTEQYLVVQSRIFAVLLFFACLCFSVFACLHLRFSVFVFACLCFSVFPRLCF